MQLEEFVISPALRLSGLLTLISLHDDLKFSNLLERNFTGL